MTAAALDGRAFEPAPLRPSWLRPLVIVLVVALHAAALSIVYLAPPKPLEPPREVIVDIEPEAAPAQAPAPPAEEPKPTEKPAPEPPPPPPQAVAPAPVEPSAPPPVVEEPALPPPPPEAQPPLPAVEAPPPPAPVELKPAKPPPPPRRIEPRPKPEPVRQRPETNERKRTPEPRRTTASLETGQPETQPGRSAPASAASQSAYISEISGAIRSRLFYPPAARARGARGVVGVAFTIGASGAVTSFAITRSSGDRDLDAAARELVHSVRFPPPPAGSAHVATSFNYEPR